MVLSDVTIQQEIKAGNISVSPLGIQLMQPASIDLHLSDKILVFKNSTAPYIDLRRNNSDLTDMVEIPDKQPFILHPGEFVLGSTIEHIGLGNNIVARLDGKSSLGRVGLLIHSTAGFIDPGWSGTLTLELSNVSQLPLTLYKGMPIGQISFEYLTTPVEIAYGHALLGSRYQGQTEPTPSRSHIGFDGSIKPTR